MVVAPVIDRYDFEGLKVRTEISLQCSKVIDDASLCIEDRQNKRDFHHMVNPQSFAVEDDEQRSQSIGGMWNAAR